VLCGWLFAAVLSLKSFFMGDDEEEDEEEEDEAEVENDEVGYEDLAGEL
jgi:hypothetical protein